MAFSGVVAAASLRAFNATAAVSVALVSVIVGDVVVAFADCVAVIVVVSAGYGGGIYDCLYAIGMWVYKRSWSEIW